MIEVESHPPERRKGSTVLMAHGCCCCCCLHVVGGLAGAAFGSVRRGAPPEETLTSQEAIRAETEIRESSRYAAKVYWLVLALLALLAAGVATLVDPSEPGISLFLILFFLPGGQLAAAGLTLAYVHARPPVRKAVCLSRLGRITLFGFLGALVGSVGVVISFLTMA